MGVSPTSTSTATITVFSTLLRSQGGGAHETLGVPPCERQNHDKVEEETIVAVGIEVGDTPTHTSNSTATAITSSNSAAALALAGWDV